MRRTILIIPVVALLLSGASCQRTAVEPMTGEENQPQAGLANPASVHCEEQGGRLEIRTGDDGGQTGFCIFADSSECEEWSYFRGECQPADQVEDISGEIRPLFMRKYDKDDDEVTVHIDQQTADYARGGVKFGEGGIGEGGIFLAAKVDGEWELVFDGNGMYSCSQLEPYRFPESMAPDCIE